MYNRMAVIIRGHVRTWNYIKDINFQLYESISKNVEYYFVTWDLPYNHDSIINDFKDKNLIKYLTVEKDPRYYNALTGPSWLSHNILPYKHLREKEVTYDVIFEIRPDVINVRPNQNDILPVEDMTVCVQWVKELSTDVGIDDLRSIMKSDVYDIFCERHKFNGGLDPNISLKKFYDSKKIKTVECNNFISFFIRPTLIEFIKSFDPKDPNPILGAAWDLSMDWKNLSNKEQSNMLNKYNILLEDFSVKKYD